MFVLNTRRAEPMFVDRPKVEVSEKEACAIAEAVWSEFSQLPGSSSVQSSSFLQKATRLARTSHENSFTDVCERFGLRAQVPLSFVDIGLKDEHPILSVSNMIRCLSKQNKIDLLLTGHSPDQLQQFWEQWRGSNFSHPVFQEHQGRLDACVPVFLHLDEGTSIKKRGLMVVHWQPTLGKGTSRNKNDMNMIGSSIATRFLYSCMLAKVYGGKQKNKPLLLLTKHLGKELRTLFYDGLVVNVNGNHQRLFIICIGMKGDWAGLAKVGELNRSFHRDAPAKPFGKGICHLCKAGQENHPWHLVDYESMVQAHQDVPPPWRQESPLVEFIPCHPYKASFFCIDIFHTCHKGLCADIAANGIAPLIPS